MSNAAAAGAYAVAETDSRRAVSTAFSAVFHCLAADCANLLIGQDRSESGGSEPGFYRTLIATADQRFDDHLARRGKGH